MKVKNGCGKVLFHTMAEARQRAKELNEKKIEKGYPVRYSAYACNNCNRFHLTSQEKQRVRSLKTPEGRTQRNERVFIAKETEFWKKRFNIKD